MTKPITYEVICISLYPRDLELIHAQVAELKQRGMTKANASMLVRLAIAQLDLDAAMREPAQPSRTFEQIELIAKHKRPTKTRRRTRAAPIGDRDIKPDNVPHDAAEGATTP